MTELLTYGILILCVTDVCLARGGRGDRYVEPQSEKRTYPSEVRRMYYVYYLNYFTASGMLYARTAAESARTVTICSNYEPFFENGTYLGEFPCPMEKDPDTFSHCCGDTGYEYCCRAIDSRSVRVGIGLGSAAILGITLAFVACVVMNIREKRRYRECKRRSKQYMNEKGIPHYNDKKTRYYSAIQSYDGYQILVTFHKMRYYYIFYEKLRMKYIDISWRYDEVHQVTEGKIAYGEDDWVNLIISDDYEGSPIMIVMREKSAVAWMEKEFEELVSTIPEEGRLICCCCSNRGNKTHPAVDDGVQRLNESEAKLNNSKNRGSSNGRMNVDTDHEQR